MSLRTYIIHQLLYAIPKGIFPEEKINHISDCIVGYVNLHYDLKVEKELEEQEPEITEEEAQLVKKNIQKLKDAPNLPILSAYIYGDCELNSSNMGAYGFVLLNQSKDTLHCIKVLPTINTKTTPYQLALRALIGLLSDEDVERISNNAVMNIFTDSNIIVNGIKRDLENWKNNNYITKNGKELKYKEDWIKIDNSINRIKHRIMFCKENDNVFDKFKDIIKNTKNTQVAKIKVN